MHKKLLYILAILVSQQHDALAQQQNNGNNISRVIMQNGLPYSPPGQTAISGGTLSLTAKQMNAPANQVLNPELPGVQWGSAVRKVGDAIYTPEANRSSVGVAGKSNEQSSSVNSAINGLPTVTMGSHVRTPGDRIRSDLHPEYYGTNDRFWHPTQRAPSVTKVSIPSRPATYETGGAGKDY